MSYVQNNLIKDEEVKYSAHLHPIIFFAPIFWTIIFIIIGIILNSFPDSSFVGILVIILGLIFLIKPYLQKISTEMAVTNKRVIIKTGIISRKTLEMNLSKIENIMIDQGILDRMLNFGKITVVGTGGTKEPFKFISDPLEFRKAVQSQSV